METTNFGFIINLLFVGIPTIFLIGLYIATNSGDYNREREELSGYTIYRANVTGGPYTTIDVVDATTTEYLDTDGTAGLVNELTYYYVVDAIYGDINSDYSNEASASSNEASASSNEASVS